MAVKSAAEAVVRSIEEEYRGRTQRSAELFNAAGAYIAGGASRSLVWFRPHPPVMAQGKGARFQDVDGNEYIDLVNCQSALVHGHAHPGITAAIQRQAERGVAWSAASEEEATLARIICERTASVQRLRFCSSGTEAGMYAVRIARAFTGKEKILKFEGGYHGSYDDVEPSKMFKISEAGPPDDPVPVMGTLGFTGATTGHVLVAPFNNRDVVARRIREHRHDLAAVIVEPVIGAGGMIPPEEGFFPFLRQITREHGILLIADEVVTFRLAYGGAQELFGIQPDLTMLGKTIGGGLPVGAVGGREDLMMLSSYDMTASGVSRLSLSGTFSGAAIGMVAGRASLEALDVQAIQRINELGELMRQQLREALTRAGITAQVTGVGSLLQLHFTDHPIRDYRAASTANRTIMAALHLWLLNRGIAGYWRGAMNISTAMTEHDVGLAVQAIREGLLYLKPFIEAEAPHLVAA